MQLIFSPNSNLKLVWLEHSVWQDNKGGLKNSHLRLVLPPEFFPQADNIIKDNDPLFEYTAC